MGFKDKAVWDFIKWITGVPSLPQEEYERLMGRLEVGDKQRATETHAQVV